MVFRLFQCRELVFELAIPIIKKKKKIIPSLSSSLNSFKEGWMQFKCKKVSLQLNVCHWKKKKTHTKKPHKKNQINLHCMLLIEYTNRNLKNEHYSETLK